VGLPCHDSFAGMDKGQCCSKDLGKGAAVPDIPQRQTVPRDKDCQALQLDECQASLPGKGFNYEHLG